MPEGAAVSRLTLTVERRGTTAVVRCTGRLVTGVTDSLYGEVTRLMPECKRVVLDFANLTHMDSTGIGTLVRLYVHAKSAGCELELMNMGKSVQQLLGITHLLNVFAVIGEHNIRW